MLYDLHIHTKYSDGEAKVQDVIEASKKQNIGVSITDHNHIKGAIEGFELSQKFNTKFICGIEIGTEEGKELLIYFSNPQDLENFYINKVEPFKTSRMTRISKGMKTIIQEEVKEKYNFNFTTIPHPFGPLKKNINSDINLSKEIINFVDSIEVINGTQSNKVNQKAFEFAQMRIDKLMTASSDAHLIRDIGKVLTDIEIFEDKIISTKIMPIHRYEKNVIETLYQISKSNINHTILKRGYSV